MAFGDTATIEAESAGKQVNIVVTETGMTELRVYRVTSGGGELTVRGANNVGVIGPGLWVGTDYEAPPDASLSYAAEITDGVSTVIVGPVTATGMVSYGGDYLMPVGNPLLGMNVNVERGGVGDFAREIVRDLQPVLNRPSPVAVSYGRRYFSGDMTFLTLTDASRRQMISLLDFPVMMFMARTGYGFDQPVYVSVGSAVETRTSGLGTEESRRWTLSMQKVDRPPPDFPYAIVGQSWQTVLSSGDDWQDIENTYSDFYDLAGYP